jgi:hypothetical protein
VLLLSLFPQAAHRALAHGRDPPAAPPAAWEVSGWCAGGRSAHSCSIDCTNALVFTPPLCVAALRRCSFTMQVPPWAPGWTGTLRLRFSHWDALLPQPEPAGVPLKGMLAVRPPAGVGARQAALEAASGVVSESEAKYVAEEAAWAKASLSSPGNNQHPDASLDTAPCHHHSATASTNRAHNVYVPSLTAAQLVAAQATRAAHALAATWHSVSALLNIKQATGALAPSASGPHTSSRPSLDRRLLGMDNTQVALGDAAWRAVVPLHTVLLFEVCAAAQSRWLVAVLRVPDTGGSRALEGLFHLQLCGE